MYVIKNNLSPMLHSLFLAWIEEHENNLQHDVDETAAWNELVLYLMKLEKGTSG